MTLVVENLSKAFQNVPVWTNISARFEPGEVVSIQGRSGEGKTTFLRVLNDLEKVDTGSIHFDETYLCRTFDASSFVQYSSSKERNEYHSRIGMVFQDYNLFSNMNVWNNLVLAPRYHKHEVAKVEARADELLARLGLSDRKTAMPAELSGGQRQRVAIARACMLDPEVLCFDEPTSALDRETIDEIAAILQNLAQQGMCILLVTHDLEFSQQVSDRILKIDDGKMVEVA